MESRFMRALCLLLCLWCALQLCLAEELSYELIGDMTVVNCESWVSLRAAPSTSAERVIAVPLGATVTAYQVNDAQFYYCVYEGYKGYILRQYLSPMGLDDVGELARLWDLHTGDTLATSVWMNDAGSDPSDAVAGELGGVAIGAYADWLLTYSPWNRDANGFLQTLMDDCADTGSEVPAKLRAGSVSLNASELHSWNGGRQLHELYDFTLVNGNEVYELLFFCYSEADGGELTEWTIVEE